MKNILRTIETILLGILLTTPFTLLASNSGKQPSLNFELRSQVRKISTNNSNTLLKIKSNQDSSTANLPKIQFSNPFPNPASSFVRINYSFPSANDNGELRIMDLTGKTVMAYPLQGTNNTLRVNISELTRGLYFFTMYYKGQLIKSNKLVVSNR